MYIIVHYKDPAELSSLKKSASNIDPGTEQTLLVHPKCSVRVMLEYIRKTCNLAPYTVFDLCDETGKLKGLFKIPFHEYADCFEEKEHCYLIVFALVDKKVQIYPQVHWENSMYNDLRDKVRLNLDAESVTFLHALGGATVGPATSNTKTFKDPGSTRSARETLSIRSTRNVR